MQFIKEYLYPIPAALHLRFNIAVTQITDKPFKTEFPGGAPRKIPEPDTLDNPFYYNVKPDFSLLL